MFLSSARDDDLEEDIIHFAEVPSTRHGTGSTQSTIISAKIVILGQGGIGKTTLMMRHSLSDRPEEFTRLAVKEGYIPTVWESFHKEVSSRDNPSTVLDLSLWDVVGDHEDPSDLRFRRLSYHECACIILGFDVSRSYSFVSLKDYWYPDLCEVLGSVSDLPPIVVVGLKSDLRLEEDLRQVEGRPNEDSYDHYVESSEAIDFAEEIGAAGYFECSAIKDEGEGVEELFAEVNRVVLINNGVRCLKPRCLLRKKRKESLSQYSERRLREARIEFENRGVRQRVRWFEKKEEAIAGARAFREQYVEGRLSQDIILHILHEFVLLRIRDDVGTFSVESRLYEPRGENLRSAVRSLWYGVIHVGQARQFVQPFANFHVSSFEDCQYLPSLTRWVQVGEKRNSSRFALYRTSPSTFYSHSSDLDSVRFEFSQVAFRLSSNRGVVSALIEFRSPSEGLKEITSRLQLEYPDLRSLALMDEGYRRIAVGSQPLRLPKLDSLVLSGEWNSDFVTFSPDHLPCLTHLIIFRKGLHGSESTISLDRLRALASLPFIRSVYFRRMNLRACTSGLGVLLPVLKRFVLCHCDILLGALRDWRLGKEFPRIFIMACKVAQDFPLAFVDQVLERAAIDPECHDFAFSDECLSDRMFGGRSSDEFDESDGTIFLLRSRIDESSNLPAGELRERFLSHFCPSWDPFYRG